VTPQSSPPSDVESAAKDAEITVADHAAAASKVQLDIDDAPFLRPEPEPPAKQPEEPLPETPDASTDDDAAEAARKRKKRLLIAAGGGLALVLAGAFALWWFVFRAPPPPAPQVVVVPGQQPDKAPAAPAEVYINFAPFLLELDGGAAQDKNRTFLLVCKFTAVTANAALFQEAQTKMVVLRDALYFYLINKDYSFLTDPNNTQTIKNDLKTVVNTYLAVGKVDEILFESYVGR
jgi:flagellar FliL protein